MYRHEWGWERTLAQNGGGDVRKTRLLVAAGGLTLLGVAVGVGFASAGPLSGSTSAQSLRQMGTWRSQLLTTANAHFSQIPGLGGRLCATGEVAATLSVTTTGAPAQFQIVLDDGPTIPPGAITVNPATSATASFTFVANVQPFEANDHHVFSVAWRSPTARATHLQSATLNVVYQRGTHAC